MEAQRSPILCHKTMGLGLFTADSEKRIRYPTIAKRAIAAKIGDETLSEELRVLYVAMTRAKDRLIMTYASNRLEKDLNDIVRCLDIGGKELLLRQAVCPGDWVLLTALQRAEAGALFSLGGRPGNVAVSDRPWKISVVTAPLAESNADAGREMLPMPTGLTDRMAQMLSFRYDHIPATAAPSKMTATQRKGRLKDEEAAEHTRQPSTQRQWRRPGFVAGQGKDYGNATHAVLQYIRYSACGDEASVTEEIHRLARQRYISEEQARLVDSGKIARFFASPLGQRLRTGEVVREFKFSILEDGSAYDLALVGEYVLLQGVVDCALIESDGITILDFKTDHVSGEALAQRCRQYGPQVEAYADAMRRIYRKPIKKTLLYFFDPEVFVEM